MITIRPENAELTHDIYWFKKMRPHVVARLGGFEQHSGPSREGGLRPFWEDECLEFKVGS
jgi:hypothetical protein